MIHKIIYYCSQYIDILTELVVLVIVIIFILGNLKDCPIITASTTSDCNPSPGFFCTKTKVEFNKICLK